MTDDLTRALPSVDRFEERVCELAEQGDQSEVPMLYHCYRAACDLFTAPAPALPGEAEIERLATMAHDAYEQEANASGWRTNPLSRVPWADVPEENRRCTRAVVRAVLSAQGGTPLPSVEQVAERLTERVWLATDEGDAVEVVDDAALPARPHSPGPAAVGIFDPEKDPVELGSGNVWAVWLPKHLKTVGDYPRPEHAMLVCITGNGPTSEANARFIAECFNPDAALAPTPEAVTRALDLAQFEGHTPGPWCIGQAETGARWPIIYAGDEDNEIAQGETTHQRSAQLRRGGRHDKWVPEANCAEREANARLIAAAPALLAEVQRLRAALDAARETPR